jgi:asparagine synthase (glutamine-hydrolysing)
MIADVPVGVFLSGGYDSSLITAILQKACGNIKTFSIGFEEDEYNEAHHAKKVATYLGTMHTEKYCNRGEAQKIIPTLSTYYDEPFADSSAIPTILVSQLAKERVKVALSADAGDELFGGYNKYSNAILSQELRNKIPSFGRKLAGYTFRSLPTSFISKVRGKDTPADLVDKFSRALTHNLDAFAIMKLISKAYGKEHAIRKLFSTPVKYTSSSFDEIAKLSGKDEVSQMLAIDYKTYLVDDILTKVDRATMSVSLEGREPLLDHRLIEFAARLPSQYKIDKLNKKIILKDLTHRYIPKNIMDRPKMGFGVPVRDWMRNELKEVFEYYLSSKSINENYLFNSKQIAEWKQKYYNGDNSYFPILWNIFIYLMWHERWA